MAERERPVGWGEPAPWFQTRTPVNPRFMFSTLGGRFIGLAFIGRSKAPAAKAFLERLASADLPQDDKRHVRFCVSSDVADQEDPLVARAFPPNRVFHDPGGDIARSYGLLKAHPETGAPQLRPAWYVLDPMMRVCALGGLDSVDSFVSFLNSTPSPDQHASNDTQLWAPVLLIPRVLEPELCRRMISVYEAGQPESSGFMRTENGKTVLKLDPSFKRRRDVTIEDEPLRDAIRLRIRDRIAPEIFKAFQFQVTRIERYIVACYHSSETGHFKAHRDNLTKGTAHRRFAVTINLNAEDYEGGELMFPEFGSRRYKPPTGGAVVFSCSLLHEATPVTSGVRYATLPFLYDDEAAKVRAPNHKYLDDNVPRPDAAPADPETPSANAGS